MTRGLLRAMTGEAIGTFALVFAGCGAIMVDAKTHQLGHVGVAITFGLVIMFGIYAVGHISGAHFNAAVTFAFALTRHFPWPRALAYWSAQFVGAICAAALLRASLGNIAHVGATLPSGSQGQAFLWELVMSAFLMFVILAVATDTRAVGEAAAIAIGGTIGLDAMFGGPITGASMNPIRSLAPALVSGDLHALWLYILAPIVGASIGGLAYQSTRAPPGRSFAARGIVAPASKPSRRAAKVTRSVLPPPPSRSTKNRTNLTHLGLALATRRGHDGEMQATNCGTTAAAEQSPAAQELMEHVLPEMGHRALLNRNPLEALELGRRVRLGALVGEGHADDAGPLLCSRLTSSRRQRPLPSLVADASARTRCSCLRG